MFLTIKNKDPIFEGERVVENTTPRRIWLDHVARYEFVSRYIKGKSVLDIACGTGYGSRIICDSGATRVIGIDISEEVIRLARDKYETDKLEFKVGDMLNIDFPEFFFNVIICFETIEHIKNQHKALLELRRVLNPKGLLIISSPNRRVTSPFKASDESPDNPFHTVEYTVKEFTQLLRGYFEILEIYGQRAIGKLFFLPIFEMIARKVNPSVYDPEKGNPELERLSRKKEYRYITAVCRKLDKGSA
ncbi:MAG: methyltransferase domain-containing protein [Candidatus Omnitrophota bacterium]|nr:MAG: methyltransferase domain-containing protein [Candidatus Omnitrophota bacterium]